MDAMPDPVPAHDAGIPTPPPPPPPRHPDAAKSYHRAKRVIHLVGILVCLAYSIAWCWIATDFVGWVDRGLDARWLALAATAVTMIALRILLHLPLDYYSDFILEKRFDLTNQTPVGWLVFQMKGWLVGAVIGGVLLVGLYASLWYAGALWSLWVWIGVMLFSIVLAKVFPLVILPIFYPSQPLDRPTLVDRLRGLAAGSGLTLTGIYNLALSKETKKANAMLAGLGSSRRVYLSDTLLEAFDDDQIAVVFAHELGHHLRGHIWKGIAMGAVVLSAAVALIHWRLHPFAAGDPADWTGAVAGLAQVILIVTVFPLVVGPLTYAVSRHFERQCDGDALRLTNNPAAYRQAFEKLTSLNLVDPDPPRWEEILFDDHPAMSKRIAMADVYVPEQHWSPCPARR